MTKQPIDRRSALKAAATGGIALAAGTLAAAVPATSASAGAIVADTTVHVRDFGAVCDGVIDDTAAVQALFTHLAANGGVGVVGGTILLTDTVTVIDPVRPFSVRSEGGHGSARFHSVTTTRKNAFTFRGLKDTRLEGFTIDGDSYLTTMHGISASNCENTTFEDLRVENYFGTAILFFKHDGFPGESTGNHMVSCSAVGGGYASNGLLIEKSSFSGLYACSASGIDAAAAAPGYGLQLKNDCFGCTIQGGSVDGAYAGVAFGYDSAASGNQLNNVVTDVSVTNCTYGFLGSRGVGNYVQINVDMGDSPSCLAALRLGGNFSNNRVEVGVLNPNAAATVATIGEDYNLIAIAYVNRLGTATLADFASTSSYNSLRVGPIGDKTALSASAVPIVDAGASNRVKFDVHDELHATNPTGASLVRFTSPTDAGSWLSLSRTNNHYSLRLAGTDVLYVSPTNVRPGIQNAQSLGDAGRQYKEAWLRDGVVTRSPNGTAYRIKVTDAGSISVTPV
ncbi:MAG: glycoside hydrolase family 55 protein [Microbacterium sp.]|jgi:hypothetical protein|nr:glycoside hydrolase family 55 protein [Microbacterium sp.]